jgi:hypothetical protein
MNTLLLQIVTDNTLEGAGSKVRRPGTDCHGCVLDLDVVLSLDVVLDIDVVLA